MGIGFVARGNNIYDGSCVVATGNTVENGMFVDVTLADAGNTVAPCAAAPTAVPMFVSCVDDTVDEQAINTEDIEFKAGAYVRHKRVLPGEVVVTSMVDGEPAVGAKVAAQNGKLKAVGEGEFAQTFVIREKDTVGGVDVYHAEALN